MKKIINNKQYNTETAHEVGIYSNSGDWRDFSHYRETLYRKKTGEYFLFGEGGPMTRYAVSEGQNGWSGGSKIIPLSYDAAREWAEKHMDSDDYEAEFGEVSEDDSTVTVTISLRADLAEKLRRKSSETGRSISSMIADLAANL